jgi:hypothetical protein
MLLPPAYRITDSDELLNAWRWLAGHHPVPTPRIQFLHLDAVQAPRALIELADLPDHPIGVDPTDLGEMVGEAVAASGGSVALLYARPGRRDWDVRDHAWCRYLAQVPLPGAHWPLHRAREGLVERVTADL